MRYEKWMCDQIKPSRKIPYVRLSFKDYLRLSQRKNGLLYRLYAFLTQPLEIDDKNLKAKLRHERFEFTKLHAR
jgi:hypothetical protein